MNAKLNALGRSLFVGVHSFGGWKISAAQLNVKMGVWETKSTTTISGAPPILQDTLDMMTPEQRAQVEAAMGKMATGRPETRTRRTCLTKKDLEKDPFNERKSCKETVLTSTGSKMEIKEVCTEEGSTINANVRIEASDSESVKGWVQAKVADGGNTMNVNQSFTSKWTGAACTEKDER